MRTTSDITVLPTLPLFKLDHVDDMSHGVVDEPQCSSNMIPILRGRKLFEVCLVTCVEFARCSRSDPTGKHLQRCNTHARFSLCWKASWYLQQDLRVSGSELRIVVGKSNIEDVGPTCGP